MLESLASPEESNTQVAPFNQNQAHYIEAEPLALAVTVNQPARYSDKTRIPLPAILELETQSTCNRTCASCLRNSHPSRDLVKDWFDVNQMPLEIIIKAFEDSMKMGFGGVLSLSHFNEPLQDPRLPEILKIASRYRFSETMIHTNADVLTEEIARELDGNLSSMIVALYCAQPQKPKREKWILSFFKKTRVVFTGGVHILTHFGPRDGVSNIINVNKHNPCYEPVRRLVLNHRSQMLLCCDDMIGNFNLGEFGLTTSLEELWFSEKHQDMVRDLAQAGSRLKYPYCASCPRSGIGQEIAIKNVHNAVKS